MRCLYRAWSIPYICRNCSYLNTYYWKHRIPSLHTYELWPKKEKRVLTGSGRVSSVPHTPSLSPSPQQSSSRPDVLTMESLRGHNLCQDFPTVSLGIWCILAHLMEVSVTLRAEGWLAAVQPCLPSRASRKFRILPAGWPKWVLFLLDSDSWASLLHPPSKRVRRRVPFPLLFSGG